MTYHIEITEDESSVCKECGYTFSSGVDKYRHIFNIHNLTFEQYIVKHYYNNIHPTCLCGCGLEMSFRQNRLGGWFKDYAPRHNPRTPLSQEVKDKIRDATIQGTLDKYGVENVFMIDSVKQKSKSTKFERYGNENYVNVDKIKETFIKKYGVDNPHKDANIKSKIKETRFLKFKEFCDKSLNVTCTNTIDDYNPSNDGHVYKFTCNVCNHMWESKRYISPCPNCNVKYCSKIQEEIWDYIVNELGVTNAKLNDRDVLHIREIDILLPDISLAIEVNGNYWHSELNGKDNNYHLEKLQMCLKNNLRLIQIFEDEWFYKKDIVKNRLKYIINKEINQINVSDYEIKLISKPEKVNFLTKYHLKGNDTSSIFVGALKYGVLMAVMTFDYRTSKVLGKKDVKNGYELVRFANIGAIDDIYTEILKFFVEKYIPTMIIAYADRRWVSSDANIYTKLNFLPVGIAPPSCWYMERRNYLIRMHQNSFKKSLLKEKLEIYDENLSEWDNMKNNQYDRIWDCGKLKYELVINT